ncbi:uncharacterized protein LOC124282397 [Haliotis rubra]|uniref:uncharacterized protein LOC124282397 n=1 Tax=Haliotis rubra TaxID=36100 RepID=UPI001EE57301|nr:uncharacterized protein LOC124282397 [Haliotis rubra]XP_046574329.1 uncharacterized protein LOC124282397 [Haliotis rubra]XP_046574330.1 uncharacterized protein LOC124282397 [Haliotis rubra]XP_046574331.1 uncharacterized protein LOC124282397 [Haliotis rubra]
MAFPWAYKPQAWDSTELSDFLNGQGAYQMEGDDFTVNILFRNDNDEIEQKTLPISINHVQSLIATGEESVLFTQIRYITTKPNLMTDSDKDIITFSYREASDEDINKKTRYVYMKTTSADQTGRIINRFRQLQFRPLEVIEDISQARIVFEAFVPTFVDRINVVVTDLRSNTQVEDKQFVVTQDQECMCLFSRSYSTKPDYQVNFWKEEGENVVEKCAVIHATQQFEISTPSYIYHLKRSATVDQLVRNITKMKPRPRYQLFDPVAMVKKQQRLNMEPVDDNPISRNVDHIAGNVEQFTYTRDTETALAESRRTFLRNFKDKLETAYQVGESNMDWHAIWEPNELTIRELLENPELFPEKDARSGGLDPDSIDHFTACTDDIVDKVFCQECAAAFSSLKNLREIFSECSYPEMAPILSDDDYTLLKKLVFKNLYEQPW